jgi:hypothetical protein
MDKYFSGLSWNLGMSHGLPFSVRNPRSKGTEFEFRPKKLGIYLIVVEWSLNGPKERIASQPAVSVVGPPVDEDGKALVKPEWIED